MSHYDVLGVARGAPDDDVRRAYLDLARRHHPDRAGGDTDRMRAINEAWATLGDPARRHRYDLALEAAAAPAPSRPGAAAWTPVEPDPVDDDEHPYGVAVAAAGWYAVVPVALFTTSVGLGLVGLLVGLPGLLGASVLVFALSCFAFVAAPLLSLYASRRGTGGGGSSTGH